MLLHVLGPYDTQHFSEVSPELVGTQRTQPLSEAIDVYVGDTVALSWRRLKHCAIAR